MANYRITAFDGLSFTQSGMYTTGGTVGDVKARFKLLQPPHSTPINPYASNVAPTMYKEINTKLLLTGDPDDVQTLVAALEAKVGQSGTLSGQAGSGTATRGAFMLDLIGDWEPPFKDGDTQWLFLTAVFQPYEDWS